MAFYAMQQQSVTNMKYKKKLKKIKRIVENYVFENAALCDQVAQIQENILCVKDERRQLLKKLVEQDSGVLIEESKNGSIYPFIDDSGMLVNVAVKRAYRKRVNAEGKTKKAAAQTTQSSAAASSNASATIMGAPTVIGSLPSTIASISNPLASLPTQTKQIFQTLPVNVHGVSTFPIILGGLSIHKLGEILPDRPGYHTENWIYPAGFVSTRIYGHMKDPERKCVYTCKIVNNGELPRFEIIPDSDMDFVIAGPTPDLCHAALIQSINSNKEVRNIEIQPQGEWFFGLAHPTVMALLQFSPKMAKCPKFKSFNIDTFNLDRSSDPSINYDALQRHIARSSYHTLEQVKNEPPDELFEQTGGHTMK